MEDAAKDFFTYTGPLGLGWLLAAWLMWRKSKDDSALRETLDRNTEALISFRVLIEERLPRGGR